MKTTTLLKRTAFFLFGFFLSFALRAENSALEPMAEGIYQPTWQSLAQYKDAPEWFKNAKFGIWAHWGPQNEPEAGDWYARGMYYPGGQQNHHRAHYGDPKVFGFKDVINEWKAAEWDPDSLMSLYKRAGIRYFFTLGNHHDNFDLWDSPYQPWNSVNMGPKRDIVGEWAAAARANGLYFGVSIHASHAWTWYEGAQDYDGNLTLADGVGKWWEGYDPQDLYAQNHPRSEGSHDGGRIHSQWNWGNGANLPNRAYLDKFYNRTVDMINQYDPDAVYFDDTGLPFWQFDNTGLKIAAHYYNKSMADNEGRNEAVIMAKVLTEQQKECIMWDIERGIPDRPQEKYWQTCTCIGGWHYNRYDYEMGWYKSDRTVIHMLIDIVSKNGNLLLSVPIRGRGVLDEKVMAVVEGIIAWMEINQESIHDTRPWHVFGEGPIAEAVNPINAQGFNEGQAYSADDIRYVCKADTIYATVMGSPSGSEVLFKSLGSISPIYLGPVEKVELLGHGELEFVRSYEGLKVTGLPARRPSNIALVFKVQYKGGEDLYTHENLSALISEAQGALDVSRGRVGTNTGQLSADSVQVFEQAIQAAQAVPEDSETSVVKEAIDKLQADFSHFMTTSSVKGGVLSTANTQNITNKTLVESRNFSRSDEGGRFGLLGEPWTVTGNIINQEGNTKGGYDNFGNSRSIGVQKWYASDPAITNGMIFQTTTLPAGSYKLRINVHEQAGLQNSEIYLAVNKGRILPISAQVKNRALAYYDMSNASTGNQYEVCEFTLTEQTQVALGWVVYIAGSAANRSMRVNEILLLDESGNDISADYIANYKNITRKDFSNLRFGTPTYWVVENFEIPQSDNSGIKNGIDKYSGYASLMMGVWQDRGNSTGGNLKDVKLYRQVTLPKGTYRFLAGYDALYMLNNMYMFVSETIPTYKTLKDEAMAYYSISGGLNDGTWHGLEFTLEEETTLYLGWIGDLSAGDTQEFRAKEVLLLRVLKNDEDYLPEYVYDASLDQLYNIPVSEVDQLKNMSWTLTDKNVSYAQGSTQGEIILGDIDFGSGNAPKKAFVETAYGGTPPAGATYNFLKDNEVVPFARVPAINTGGQLTFKVSESAAAFQLEGVHKIRVKYSGHSSNVKSVGFMVDDSSSGLIAPDNAELKYRIVDDNLIVDDLSGEDLRIYDVYGRLIKQYNAVRDKLIVPLDKGIYIICADRLRAKVII
ncbi:MAG: DUF5013 domain-containing protein [Bacteroidales bacterium]|jgi:alpha-L-fucosidase|nr:DUF5013 domain-containing protein [Bacteroidales bacterium]